MSDFHAAALAREGRDFYRGHPDFYEDEEVPDGDSVLVGRSVKDPDPEPNAAGSGLGGAEEQPERISPVRLGESTRDSGPSATPSPVWTSQSGPHVYKRETRATA